MSDIEGGREGGHVAFSISTIIKFKISTILCNKCTFMYIYTSDCKSAGINLIYIMIKLIAIFIATSGYSIPYVFVVQIFVK